MVFSSLSFIFLFLPVFLALYYAASPASRNTLLFVGSLVFYSLGEPYYLFLILISIFVNYWIGRFIEYFRYRPKARTALFLFAMFYNFGVLLFYKYINFFIENINALLHAADIDWQFYTLQLTLPLGISFYTFQIASYIIDVYRGKVRADDSIVNLGAYLCMFPQLIAGPIVVYSDIREELKRRTVSLEKFDNGLKTFIVGLGYKVILANRIGLLWNEVCTIGFESISTPLAWLGAFAYSMQLYFDFCGYSYMAVGLGEMLGFTMPVNFRHPYMSRSVTEFWRRWHITLGSWFKEYVYIPLGGNRKGRIRTIFNLFVVWFLVGFWHGAAWNFILWGIFIFVMQIIEKNLTLKWLTRPGIFSRIFSHAYMAFYIPVSWVLFAISDFSELGVYLGRMFPFFGIGTTLNPNDFVTQFMTYAPLILVCLIFSTHYPEKLYDKIRHRGVGIGIALFVFWYAVYFLAIGINNPFLYFRF